MDNFESKLNLLKLSYQSYADKLFRLEKIIHHSTYFSHSVENDTKNFGIIDNRIKTEFYSKNIQRDLNMYMKDIYVYKQEIEKKKNNLSNEIQNLTHEYQQKCTHPHELISSENEGDYHRSKWIYTCTKCGKYDI